MLIILLPNQSFSSKNDSLRIFNAGEKLKFLMHYGWIDGGYATLSIKETDFHGKKVFHAKAIGETTGLTNMLYNVHDTYESFFDPISFLPLKAIRSIKEGNYRSYNEVEFEHSQKKLKSMKSGLKIFPDSLPDMVFDLVSSFYYLRNYSFQNLKKGDLITLNNYFSDDFFLLQVRYMGNKIVKTKLGKFECLEFRPVVEPGRVFDTQDDIKIWISNDKNLIPIRVQLDLMIGSFKGDLVEYSGLKYKIKNLKKRQRK